MREKLAARSAARRETTDRVSSSTMSSRAGTGRSRPDIFDQDMPVSNNQFFPYVKIVCASPFSVGTDFADSDV